MARGIISVQLALFKDILMLPDDYKLLSAFYKPAEETINIVVEHESIPEKAVLPYVTPAYKVQFDGNCKTVSLDKINIL